MAPKATESIKKVLQAGNDHYGVLGIDKGACEYDIKKACRELALQLHPDNCSEDGTEEAFNKVREAFGVLNDPTKRRDYDQHGADGMKDRDGGGSGSGSGAGSGSAPATPAPANPSDKSGGSGSGGGDRR